MVKTTTTDPPTPSAPPPKPTTRPPSAPELGVGIVVLVYLLLEVVVVKILVLLEVLILLEVIDKWIVLVVILTATTTATIPAVMYECTLVAFVCTSNTPGSYLADLGNKFVLVLPQPAPFVTWVMVPPLRRKKGELFVDSEEVEKSEEETKRILALGPC